MQQLKVHLHNDPKAKGRGASIAMSTSSLNLAEVRRQRAYETGEQAVSQPELLGVMASAFSTPSEKLALLGLLPTTDPFKVRSLGCFPQLSRPVHYSCVLLRAALTIRPMCSFQNRKYGSCAVVGNSGALHLFPAVRPARALYFMSGCNNDKVQGILLVCTLLYIIRHEL